MGERARKTLNPRQQEVRKALVRGRGLVNNAELAVQLNCSRQQIWRDRRIIATLRPLPAEDWDEGAEVQKILADYDNQIAQGEDELEKLEAEIAARTGRKSVTGLYSVRANLVRELRQTIESRSAFLLSIGYLKAAPQRMEHSFRDISELEGEAADKEIERLEGILETRVRRNQKTGD